MTKITRSKKAVSPEAREASRQRMSAMWEKRRAAAARPDCDPQAEEEGAAQEQSVHHQAVPAPGSRAEAVSQQRRRRAASSEYNGTYLRLGYDERLLKPGHTGRWINDEKGKLENSTVRDDWEFVEDHGLAGDPKNLNESDRRIRRQVGTDATGKPLYAYLCQKRSDWYADDQLEHSVAVSETRKTVIQRMDTGGSGGVSGDPKHMYIPDSDRPAIEAEIASASNIRRSRSRKL